HRHARAGPRAGRRHRAGVAAARGRRSGDREEHRTLTAGAQLRCRRAQGALCERRGERATDPAPRLAAGRGAREPADPLRDGPRSGPRDRVPTRARHADRRLHPDAVARRSRRRPGHGDAGARVRAGDAPLREGFEDGAVAGPRVLEHMVDAVLYLEGERYQHYRVLRAAKNRFGSTHELGVFEMLESGLREVANPSEAFLSDGTRDVPGVAVVASLEGARPLLVEVQALVSTSFYGTPQRVTSGYDPRRLAVLLAVLERRVGLRLGRHDVFVTVTGGFKLDDPGADLGVALAIASSFRSRPVLPRTLALGEVSLSGELRRVPRLDARLREAAQMGFARAGFPRVQLADAEGTGLALSPLTTLREACEQLLGEKAETPRAEAAAPRAEARPAEALATAGRPPRP